METPVQKAGRLLAALQELVDQEGMYLRGGYFDLAGENRRRAAPLVRELTGLAGQPGVECWHPRVAAVLAASARHAEFLRKKMAELGAMIRQTDRARHCVAKVAPVYAGSPGAAAPRFLAAG